MIIINDITINNSGSFKKIVENTANTWQLGRSNEEKASDTSLGKIAEKVFKEFIIQNFPNYKYLSYDEFRSNNFEKHAPFDGIIFVSNKDQSIVNKYIEQINYEVKNSDYGKISDGTKIGLESNGIYTVEIKSTRVAERHKRTGSSDQNISSIIMSDDFLEYPKYLRVDEFDKINNLMDYINFCKTYRSFNCLSNSECILKMRNEEQINMRFFYVRIYIDISTRKAYIVGYIDKNFFSQNFTLKKMVQAGKSEKALYLSLPLNNAKELSTLIM
ncbi:hypothetical protein A2W67_00895 [Candidatus Nomurabacteria bacterium RIFCSPLOWO2_02_40_28]|uniref:Uncharacterized protein n=2 Tax=Candidatus Nomuraibacteriota TaxID=1752729 RepID=A0A837I213_9BACT|nr:MAG: hypothetical protein UT27_C0001G0006 [Candidatus Nomurabacteria bacterium GW2011_GWD2_39_12]KKR20727.1 MAG: hypothetical protein UT51_C0002G0162 [Candidatus Nomurabacteria bacterium GW2011_GWC2_39_41]KKR37345.1 MAG: hypothetical protein UT70_C0001G0021 [Candidatus Nomurabacteria bacterium GW2011_GWE2_40_10]KKR38592.1 MAG: hypothetical protein UT73_C0002G0077 [Candidatus Nomurabacteria bacterium GW2011_GWB1_40_11]KKR40317.1 MAG: hypothetical protein UT74_C0001G0051 [Parcubacteria group b